MTPATAGTDPTSSIAEALHQFQADLPAVSKSAQGQRSMYAPLDVVIETIVPKLNRVGICYTAQVDRTPDGWVLRSELRHVASGETITSLWPVVGQDPQSMGSAITYGRRYCLLALTGVHPAGEDDDGQTAAGPRPATAGTGTPPTRNNGASPPAAPPRGPMPLALLGRLREAAGMSPEQARAAVAARNDGKLVNQLDGPALDSERQHFREAVYQACKVWAAAVGRAVPARSISDDDLIAAATSLRQRADAAERADGAEQAARQDTLAATAGTGQ